MEEYKPNSHKSRDEKKIEKVISGAAKTKKKSEVKKLADIFISEDIGQVKSYILMDVLVPAIKKAVSDIVTNGMDMILYGESGRTKRSSIASKVSYNRFSDPRDDRRYRTRSQNAFDYDDVVFDSYGAADKVLEAMDDIISQYGVVSVLDFYDLADVSTDNYLADRYGWSNIPATCKPVRVRDGYILKLPKALPLN